jgi:hypothetical protein
MALDFIKPHEQSYPETSVSSIIPCFSKAPSPQQKFGTIVCLLKLYKILTPADRCPITLLNSYYKIVARILEQRLRPEVETHLKSTKYCGVPLNTILDDVATVRDTIAYAEKKNLLMCILTLDYKHAFDRISHSCLFTILRSYGLSAKFIHLMGNLYNGATSSVQINGHLQDRIPVRCSLRQGYPLSMALYALRLQPFPSMLEQRLPGVRRGRMDRPISVGAYVDDVTVFITSFADFTVVEDSIRQFEKAFGAHLNPQKSKALPIERRNTPDTIFGITYHPHVRFLSLIFWSTIHQSGNDTWTKRAEQIRSQAKDSYPRDLCLAHRILDVHTYLLAKMCYVAQIVPAPGLCTQQLTSAIIFFYRERSHIQSTCLYS